MTADSSTAVVFRRPELTVVRDEPESGNQPETDSSAPADVADDVPTEDVEAEATASATAEPSVETETTDEATAPRPVRTPKAKPTIEVIEAIDARRNLVAAQLTTDIEEAYMASESGRRIHLSHVKNTVNLNVSTEGLGKVRVSINLVEKFIASYKVSATAPKVKTPYQPKAITQAWRDRVAGVEADRAFVAAALTPLNRIEFCLVNSNSNLLLELILTPLDPETLNVTTLKKAEAVIAKWRTFAHVPSRPSGKTVAEDVVTESEPEPATAPVDEVVATEFEAASIEVEDATATDVEVAPELVVTEIVESASDEVVNEPPEAVLTDSAPEPVSVPETAMPMEVLDLNGQAEVLAAAPGLSVWLPGEMNELPATNAGDEAIRRFNLFVRVAQARITQARLFQSTDETIYDRLPGWSDVDSAAVFTAIDWMYRLGDDLDRLERELMLVETGLKLLAEPGE